MDRTLEIEKKIEHVIGTKVRPILQEDGGNIEFLGYGEDGTVSVRLEGACTGCPMAALTLRSVVEDMLKRHIPDLGEIRVLNVEDDGWEDPNSLS
ncbi:MAG: NifU family protein [Rickettsiales bacterium]|jgi:Fe-S cluster biogenesis protein NfuA|nr:NifU family protein [Rickettsiales bacterium]